MSDPDNIIDNQFPGDDAEFDALSDTFYGCGNQIQDDEKKLWFCDTVLRIMAGMVSGIVPDGYDEIGRRFAEHLKENRKQDDLDDQELYGGADVKS